MHPTLRTIPRIATDSGRPDLPAITTGDRGTAMANLEGHPVAQKPGQPGIIAMYRGPLMLLFIDEPTLARPDIATVLRRWAAMLPPEIARVVVSPHALPAMHALPTFGLVILVDTLSLARAVGIATLPGSALFNGDGCLLWRSGGEPRLARSVWSADQYQPRTSGALALGDVLC